MRMKWLTSFLHINQWSHSITWQSVTLHTVVSPSYPGPCDDLSTLTHFASAVCNDLCRSLSFQLWKIRLKKRPVKRPKQCLLNFSSAVYFFIMLRHQKPDTLDLGRPWAFWGAWNTIMSEQQWTMAVDICMKPLSLERVIHLKVLPQNTNILSGDMHLFAYFHVCIYIISLNSIYRSYPSCKKLKTNVYAKKRCWSTASVARNINM